jgi:uncharacterized protein YecE (DUF72 family)
VVTINDSIVRMGDIFIGCSGWCYPGPPQKGGWSNIFYPTNDSKKLFYYSQFFNTAEISSTFYDKLYSKMTRRTFEGLARATPDNFQFSLKVPETITHINGLDIKTSALSTLEEFLGKISPLKMANKVGAIIFQLPSRFAVNDLKKKTQFFDRLPRGYDFAVEFRHPSWHIEQPWEMLRHFNVATVIVDRPSQSDNLHEFIVTANHSYIRLDGKNIHHLHNYLYSIEELRFWSKKAKELQAKTQVIRGYFNNHYAGKSVMNALQFKDVIGTFLSDKEKNVLKHGLSYLRHNNIELSSLFE